MGFSTVAGAVLPGSLWNKDEDWTGIVEVFSLVGAVPQWVVGSSPYLRPAWSRSG